MTVLYTQTWTGSNGASWPADFTTSELLGPGTIDIQSNAGRMLTTATNFSTERAVLGSSNWNKADGEALITVATQASLGQFQILLRSTGDWDAGETDSATTGYKFFINMAGNTIELYERHGGTTLAVGTSQSFTFATSTTYGIKCKTQGTTIAVKVWTGTEPGPYTYTQTNSAIASAGQFQMTFRTASSAVRDLRVDDLTLDDLVGGRRPIFRRF